MEVREIVKEKYGEAARRVIEGKGLPADCCSQTSCCEGVAAASCDPITSNLYDKGQAGQIPDTALKASLGCGKAFIRCAMAMKPLPFCGTNKSTPTTPSRT